MWKLGLRPHSSFSGTICFKFSVLCFYSALLPCSSSSPTPHQVVYQDIPAGLPPLLDQAIILQLEAGQWGIQQRHNIDNLKNIPRKGITRPQSQFHIHVSVSDLCIYLPAPIDLPILLHENVWTGPGNILYKSSQTHECGNWD